MICVPDYIRSRLKMARDKELAGAKISRTHWRGRATKDTNQVSVADTAALEGAVEGAKEMLEKYYEAINKCLLAEDKDEDAEDEPRHINILSGTALLDSEVHQSRTPNRRTFETIFNSHNGHQEVRWR